jgi:DNA-directed RNA polymerase subunit RPC12/RpoP
MGRKAVCTKCGKWFYNHNGMYIVLPDTYDDSMCPDCNKEIDNEIEGKEPNSLKK